MCNITVSTLCIPGKMLVSIISTLLKGERDMFPSLSHCEQILGSDGPILLQIIQGSPNEPTTSVWQAMHEYAISKGE